MDSLKINKTEVRRRSLNDRVESTIESSSGFMKSAKDALNQAYLNQIPRIELDAVLKPRRKSADHGKEWVIHEAFPDFRVKNKKFTQYKDREI